MRELIDIILHLDRHLNAWAGEYGGWMYGLLFAIVFAETGLVVTPFLPGDSLLFAVGALASSDGSPIDVWMIGLLLTIAAITGDALNYAIGRRLGPKVFASENSRLLNKQHLMRAHAFYEKHGGKTIIIARFIPIIRTFAPFVAGIGQMSYARFATYNVVGGVAWVWSFLFLGYWFGNQPLIKKNFTLVIVAIIVISVIPAVVEFVRARRSGD
ncbi:MAG TPA: DedA family protein [Nannocystaceae bacterium]|nr:DedA family protein [Nannocystaceae bacterium]